MIPFNKPLYIGNELKCIEEAVMQRKICGDGAFTKKCSEWIENKTGTQKALLTCSGTQALEMAALLSDISFGDEVIMPSYTFVSTANAFVLRGAKVVFVDIRPDTMNMDESLIEQAINERTKAIVPVHYAGVACEMDDILAVAKEYKLKVIEDAAQGIMSAYNGMPLGSIGDYGCLSFHETKNYTMGEGGAILINDRSSIERAEIIREKGTNRNKFFRGQVDKYSWVDLGSSFLPSDINAAYLFPQLEAAEKINEERMAAWEGYRKRLAHLADIGKIELPFIPDHCQHNAHMFYIKAADIEERRSLIGYLKDRGISTVFHYVPLHSSAAGKRFGEFCGQDVYTSKESERLLRLPMFYGLTELQIEEVTDAIQSFYMK